MSVSSADPGKLQAFVTGVSAARVSAASEQSSVAALSSSVIAASPDYHYDVPALAALSAVLEAMGANETFVATVRSELLAADVNAVGAVTVGDAQIAAALANNGVATPPPPVQFDPATMVGLPPTSGFVDDPICAANGNMIHQDTDVVFPAIAGALGVVRTWNSLVHDRVGAFGPGWSSVLDARLDVAPWVVRAHLADGAVVAFGSTPDGRTPAGRRGLRLEPDGDGWVLHTDHVRSFMFDDEGRLTGWHVGVARVTVTRDGTGRIIGLHEQVTGRSLAVLWAGGLVESLTTDDGRTVSYTRRDDGAIVEAKSHAGSLEYRWDGTLLTSVVDADGVAAFTNVYDDTGRVLRQTSPFGRVTTYRYDPSGQTVITDGAGVHQAMIHDRAGNLVAVVDSDGSTMRLTYDDAQRVVRVVERDGSEWRYEYDGRDDLVRRTDPDGLTHSWAWDDRHRLVAETDRAGTSTRTEFDTEHRAPNRVIGPDGAVVSQVLDDRGLPLEITDADGVVTRFTWDRDGLLLATTDALGGATGFDYDAHGLLVRLTVPTGAATTLVRDGGGRVLRTERGDRVSTYTYTAAGRITAGTEPGDVAWSATFGDHGAMASISDVTGATVSSVTTRSATSRRSPLPTAPCTPTPTTRSTATWRPSSRPGPRSPRATTPAAGSSRSPTPMATCGGVSSTRSGRTVSRQHLMAASPGGRTIPTARSPPSPRPTGECWTTEIDAAGRPTAVVDPAGRRAQVDYTPGGRIRQRRSPGGRTETFDYDAAGRLSAVVGIDGARRTLDRNLRGFVVSVTDPERRIGLEWDDDYRLIGVTTDDGTASIVRDAGGRVIETTDATGVTARVRGTPVD